MHEAHASGGAGVDWTQVKQLIDCSAELRELVAPDGAEDLFTGVADLLPSLGSGTDGDGTDGDSDSGSVISDTLGYHPSHPSLRHALPPAPPLTRVTTVNGKGLRAASLYVSAVCHRDAVWWDGRLCEIGRCLSRRAVALVYWVPRPTRPAVARVCRHLSSPPSRGFRAGHTV